MTPLPLIEPNMQISSIRLTDKCRRKADAGSDRHMSQVTELIASQARIKDSRPVGTDDCAVDSDSAESSGSGPARSS